MHSFVWMKLASKYQLTSKSLSRTKTLELHLLAVTWTLTSFSS
jgi:hypothetical protein